MCGTWAPGAQVCFQTRFPSVHFSALQLFCDSKRRYRWPRLRSCAAVVHIGESETATSSSSSSATPFFSSSSGKLQTTGAGRAQRPAVSESTWQTGTRIHRRFWAHKPSIRRRGGAKRSGADATPAITKNLCQICSTCAANKREANTAGFFCAATLLTCMWEFLQQVSLFEKALAICAFFYSISFFALMSKLTMFFSNHVFPPRLYSEGVPRWAHLAVVAVTDGKDDNSSDKQWTNCTLQRRRLITLGTHLRRLRHSSNCALDALICTGNTVW